jgi:type II secretory pathway pseudopilin PulG
MTMIGSHARVIRRRGITLTEILIAILILAVGLASLATLFPLGLLRLRDAARSTRSAYLTESAAADIVSRGLLTNSSFAVADQFNYLNGLTPWFTTTTPNGGQIYTPLTQDTPGYYQDWNTPASGGNPQITLGTSSSTNGGYGLPFAYDPLWRFQTISKVTGIAGYYMGDTLEARFGAGLGFIQSDPAGDGFPPSAHGLQRLTNFNRPSVTVNGVTTPIMPISATLPNIFVSPEDVVWVENTATGSGNASANSFSPILPDMSISADGLKEATPINDWHYSWMFTGQQNNSSSSSTFDGNIVIFENRPFAIEVPGLIPNPPGGIYQAYQVEGETVVEAIWGYSAHVSSFSGGAPGFGSSADRSVLLRWYASEPDPVVHVGDWIADVTYERNATVVGNLALGVPGRFFKYTQFNTVTLAAINGSLGGLQNPFNNGEWDNLPAQRCFWYRVVKTSTPAADTNTTAGSAQRSMVVYVDRTLQARTPITSVGVAATVNAALICPSVVNVIPQTIFTR